MMFGLRGFWLLVPLLVVPLSGCLTGGEGGASPAAVADAAADPAPPPPAPRPEPTATTGALVGLVRAADLSPLSDAGVLVGPVGGPAGDRIVRTDAAGRFTVSDLVPGRYALRAAAPGFAATETQAEVRAGAVTEVRLLLAPVPSTEPYSVPVEFRGFMAFGAAAAGARYTNGLQDPNHAVTFGIDVFPEALETLMLRVSWDDPAAGLELDLWHNVTCSPCEPEHEYAHAGGNEEIAVRLDRPEDGWAGMRGGNETLWLFLWAAATDGQPVSVAYQVPFDVQVEAFYHGAAPEGHDLAADG